MQEFITEASPFYVLMDAQLENPSIFSQNGVYQFLLTHSSKSTFGLVVYQIVNALKVSSIIQNVEGNPSTMSFQGTDSLGESGIDVGSNCDNSDATGKDIELTTLIESLKTPKKSKVLPPLSEIVEEISDSFADCMDEFEFECKKYGFDSRADKVWYAKLEKKVTSVAEDLNYILEKETEYLKKWSDNNLLDHRNFSIHDEYRAHTSWAIKTFSGNFVGKQVVHPERETERSCHNQNNQSVLLYRYSNEYQKFSLCGPSSKTDK